MYYTFLYLKLFIFTVGKLILLRSIYRTDLDMGLPRPKGLLFAHLNLLGVVRREHELIRLHLPRLPIVYHLWKPFDSYVICILCIK